MAVLSYTKQRVIGVAPDEVFDFCSDLRNELVWNPNAEQVEKLVDGPVRVGTRFRARWSNAGEVIVEVVEFDRPQSWATRSIARGMEVVFRGTVAAQDDGTRFVARMELRPRGVAWLYAPLALLAMRRQDVTNMRLIKESLESGDEDRLTADCLSMFELQRFDRIQERSRWNGQSEESDLRVVPARNT